MPVETDRSAVAALMLFAVFRIVLAVLGKLHAGHLAQNVALAIPFALVIGFVNPFFDREVPFHLGSLPVTAGKPGASLSLKSASFAAGQASSTSCAIST